MRIFSLPYFLLAFSVFSPSLGRKHELVLEGDTRKYFSITTFGFFSGGKLEVKLNYLTFLSKHNGVFGLTLTKTISDSITPYMESHQNECLLSPSVTEDENVEIISFLLDPKKTEVTVNCSRLSSSLEIQPLIEPNSSSSIILEDGKKQSSNRADSQNAAQQLIKVKRSAQDDEPPGNDDPRKMEDPVPADDVQVSNAQSDTAKDPEPKLVKSDSAKANVESDKLKSSSDKLNAAADEGKTDSTKPKRVEGNENAEVTVKDNAGENSVQKQTNLNELSTNAGPKSGSKSCGVTKLSYKNDVVGNRRRIYDLKFIVNIRNKNGEGLYSLFFHNCGGFKDLPIPVNLSVSITEKNVDSYLSAGEMPLPKLYFLMSLTFFITGCVWVSVLRRKKEEVFKIHYLMGLLVFVKSLSLLFHGINFHIIANDGYPMEAWAVLYYITHLLKGALLFITIVLIGTGWAFIKHILSDKDKKIFMIVIPLQVLANVAKIIMEESEEGNTIHYTWREVFILVDLVCCGAILFPVVWSIRHLQEASHIDGKAAINLEKLKLFRHFYVMIVCYIYFTRIIVYLLKITVPFYFEWLDEIFRETATLTFFILTGYNFRPTTSNPYFRLSQEEDMDIEEVITQTGITEAAVKTVRSRDTSSKNADDNSTANTTTKRESSHEYD